MQWFKKWDQFINENLFVNKIKDNVQDVVIKCGFQALSFESIFQIDPNQNLELLIESSDFLQKLQEKNLRTGTFEKSNDLSSLLINPIQYVLIYNEGESEEKNPVYLIVQDFKSETFNPIQLFYVTESINKFFEYLTNRLITVTKTGDDKEWIYKTTNAGENWTLQNSDQANSLLKTEMYGDELAELERNSVIKIDIK